MLDLHQIGSRMTTIHEINYRKRFYEGDKPYRDCLVAALKHFKLTEFTKNSEFWTLGGKEWYEYYFLKEQGLTFDKASYHNVDHGDIDQLNEPAVVRHKRDFFDIWEIWNKPTVLCFDSTNGLVSSNEPIWMNLIQLGIAAAKVTSKVSLNWNFLAGYGNILYDRSKKKDKPHLLFARYERWLSIMLSHFKHAGFTTTFFECSVMAPKEHSKTPMISGHCLIEKSR